jgi:hypothetical protein
MVKLREKSILKYQEAQNLAFSLDQRMQISVIIHQLMILMKIRMKFEEAVIIS